MDTAEVDGNPTGSGTASYLGVNFATTDNNSTFSGALGTLNDEEVGAISEAPISRTKALYIGSGNAATGGYLTLAGAIVNSQANTILSDMSAGNFHIVSGVGAGTTAPCNVLERRLTI